MSFFNHLFEYQDSSDITGLTFELKAIYTYNKFLKSNQSVILITSSLFEANNFYKSLKNYTEEVLFFPMDDFLTSEALAISPELRNNRLIALSNLSNKKKKIVVTNLMGYLRYLPFYQNYLHSILSLCVNQEYFMKDLISEFYSIGYERVSIVSKTGEVAVRGFVIDIFPLKCVNPIRLEFWGDTLDSIREFNVETQLTISNLQQIDIYPNTEFITTTKEHSTNQKDLPLYCKVTNISSYLNNPIVIMNEMSEIKTNYHQLQEEILNYNTSMSLDPMTKYMNGLEEVLPSEFINLTKFDNPLSKNISSYNSYEIENFPKNIDDIYKYLNRNLKINKTIIICVSNQYQINKILDNFSIQFVVTNENQIFENKINIIIKNIESGFIFNNYIVISEKEFFHKNTSKITYKNNFKYGTKIRDINKLNIGDYVVHNIHGIGRYLGIQTLDQKGLKKDYLIIEYKDHDKLYIPVEKIELITKYSSNSDIEPKINKLGGSEWNKTKLRIKKRLENIAGELLNLYAIRESSKGFAFKKDDSEQIEFENNFIYEDTLDQRKVTEEIKRDMEKERPMDRLLCGDVGYGKTEIAFRAMFKAVMSGKQVAYLCPTTILSNQHYINALERFKEYPINIVCLNRFISSKEVKKIINGLKTGIIDIVIGTHRILSEDIYFKDLGLLVIDEEQRFGVKHKEKIKQLKNNIDVLTLSATPIPRTLQMSMVGIRDLSLIETPPVNRYPIQTYVLEENNHIIKDAIYKELSREGQVFILYNHVAELENKVIEISKLVPEARITFAHGKMTKTELENVMMQFINKEYDILLCTTIIETGIDIPTVNTLIIMDADRFGLSQLYQIRGRVGRGNIIAYCYLMYKRGKILSEIANKRLSVIKEFTELGSGFAIAMRDLSIRGAGDILGSEQAGFIDSIGIELYLKMLEDEINKLKGIQPIEEELKDEQPFLSVATTIDDKYVADTDLKIEIHKKINEINSYDKLNEIKLELEDRFGKLNEDLLIYMYEELFENKAKKIGIIKVRQTNNFIELTLNKELTNLVDGQKLFLETSKLSRMFRFKMFLNSLIVTLDIIKLDKHYIYYLLDFIKILEESKK